MLRRCVLELHAILSKKADGGGEFDVAMTAEERNRFLTEISNGGDGSNGSGVAAYYHMLATINAEKSDCSRTVDRESIHSSICQSIGFSNLGRHIFSALEQWMEMQLRVQVALNVADGDIVGAMKWNAILAVVLGKQGKHQDALILQLQVLNVFQRELSPEDTDIGEFLPSSRCCL